MLYRRVSQGRGSTRIRAAGMRTYDKAPKDAALGRSRLQEPFDEEHDDHAHQHRADPYSGISDVTS